MHWMISEPADLREVNQALHDRWFNIDSIVRRGAILAIPVSASASTRAREEDFTYELEIEPVREHEVDDSERIGMYDLDYIELVDDREILCFHFNIPLGLAVRVLRPVKLSLRARQLSK